MRSGTGWCASSPSRTWCVHIAPAHATRFRALGVSLSGPLRIRSRPFLYMGVVSCEGGSSAVGTPLSN
jgi:hypothetical protein